MYKCCDCGYVFEEPKNYSEDRTPGYSCESSFMYRYSGCPSCSGNYEEAKECDGCGEYFLQRELDFDANLCEECFKEDDRF